MRKTNNNIWRLPIVEIDSDIRAWVIKVPAVDFKTANLKWPQFLLANQVNCAKNQVKTIFTYVEARGENEVFIQGYAPQKNNRPDRKTLKEPVYSAVLLFEGSHVDVNDKKNITYIIEQDIAQRIIPTVAVLMATKTKGVILKEKERNYKAYTLQRMFTAYGKNFEIPNLLKAETEQQSAKRGLVVKIKTEDLKQLENDASKIRQDMEEMQLRNNSELKSLQKLSAIFLYDENQSMILNIRNLDNIIEISYFEEDVNKIEMLLYSDFNLATPDALVVIGMEDPEYVSIARKIISIIENVLMLLNTWDWEHAQKEDGSYYPCNLVPVANFPIWGISK